jgi:hypothetical protein
MTGSVNKKTPLTIEMREVESTAQGLRARLGAKLKLAIEWIQQHLLFFTRW